MAGAARAAGVSIVTGDTKVVERGKADGMYVATTGVGVVDAGVDLGPERVQPGDRVLVSGTIGDHGTAVMLARGELEIEADVESDTRPLWDVARALLETVGGKLRCMRDATRGGVATVLNEIALAGEVGVVVAEDQLPVRGPVAGASELLGIDPLYVANEGKLVAFVAGDAVSRGPRRSARRAGRRGRCTHRRGGRGAARAGAGPHRVRRPPHDRHARGRPAAPDLLTSRR